MTRTFLVVNPSAGGGRTERLWASLADEVMRLGLQFDFALTRRPDHGTELARRAAAEGWPLVVAVGGDGTLNEVVNGVTDTLGTAMATVGAILTGRGRDGCRNLGLAADWRLAARRLLEGSDARLDLGAAEWPDGARRYFVSVAGVGFDATVARRVRSRGGAGTLPYLRAVVESLVRHRVMPAGLRADDGAESLTPLTAAVVANGSHFGGGMKIAPSADPADGLLDLVILRDLGRAELLRWLPAVYRGGHLANPRVSTRRVVRVSVAASSPLPTHVDGEAAADTPVTFRVCPLADPAYRQRAV